MKKIVVLLFIIISTITGASESSDQPTKSVKMSASLLTGLVAELNASFVIKPSPSNPETLVIERWNLCSSFPCHPKDHMELTEVTPVLIRDERAGDGSLEIKLTDEMTITYQNSGLIPPGNKKSKTDYKLLYKSKEKIQEIPLYLYAGFSIQN